MSHLFDTLRDAIENADESASSIAEGSGVNKGQISRFLSRERGLSVESCEAIAEYLGIEIILRKKKTLKRKTQRRT